MIFQIRSIFAKQSSINPPEDNRKNGGKEGEEKKITRAVLRASTEAIMRDYRELLNLPVCTD